MLFFSSRAVHIHTWLFEVADESHVNLYALDKFANYLLVVLSTDYRSLVAFRHASCCGFDFCLSGHVTYLKHLAYFDQGWDRRS